MINGKYDETSGYQQTTANRSANDNNENGHDNKTFHGRYLLIKQLLLLIPSEERMKS